MRKRLAWLGLLAITGCYGGLPPGGGADGGDSLTDGVSEDGDGTARMEG